MFIKNFGEIKKELEYIEQKGKEYGVDFEWI